MLRRESNKDWMKGQIASSLPGRLRLRVEGLGFLFDARMDVAGELATIAGVRRVQVTPCTGSVLLEYDQNKLDSAALVECADMVLARYAMPALRARHASGKEETAEQPMTTARLAKRLAVIQKKEIGVPIILHRTSSFPWHPFLMFSHSIPVFLSRICQSRDEKFENPSGRFNRISPVFS